MEPKIIETHKEHLPRLRFIGKRYTDEDRGPDGGYGHLWDEWFELALFEFLEESHDVVSGNIGLMTCTEAEGSFEYWIGKFCDEYEEVSEGYDYIDMPESDIAVSFIQGNPRLAPMTGQAAHNMCMASWSQNKLDRYREAFDGYDEKRWFFFERYHVPRYTVMNQEGEVILDYCMYID